MTLNRNRPFFLMVALSLAISLTGQTQQSGPIIEDYGEVWTIPQTDYALDTKQTLRAVFDIMDSPEDPSALNRSIETAARFLNMHAQNGMAAEQLKVALVLHNKASKDILAHEAYRKRFGVENPNADLVKALLEADVQLIFCGQSSLSRGYPKEELLPGIQLSLSAMTALIQLQNEGYRLIKF
jgi:intracellular sulfur oxidation DsrE/DsrF family protein